MERVSDTMQWPTRKLSLRFGLCCVVAAAAGGCFKTPTFDEVVGQREHEKNEAVVADVVELVKCELAGAFKDKLPDEHFRWMADWTAKSELTLQVNNSGGISPGIGNPNFNGLTLGLDISGQGQRVETISFSVALRDLAETSASRCEELREESKEEHSRELQSGLKLKSWISAALRPVEQGLLQAVFRQQQGLKLSPPAAPASMPPPAPRAAPAVPPAKFGYEGFREEFEEIAKLAEVIEREAGQVLGDRCKVDDTSARIERNIEIVKAKLRGVKTLYPDDLLSERGQEELASVEQELKTLNRLKNEKKLRCEKLPNFGATARADATEFREQMNRGLFAAFKRKDYLKKINAESTYLGQVNEYLKGTSEQLAGMRMQFDPPIDSLSHHVQFVLVTGVNASLKWGLFAVNGVWGNPASLARTRTHTLVLTIAPPNQQGLDEKSRLLTTSSIRGVVAPIAGR